MAQAIGSRQRFIEDEDRAVGVAQRFFRLGLRHSQQWTEDESVLLGKEVEAAAHAHKPGGDVAPLRRQPAVSFDTIFSLALFAGALFLMMRFGSGAHMSHAHGHGASESNNESGDSGKRSASAATQGSAQYGNAHRHGCC